MSDVIDTIDIVYFAESLRPMEDAPQPELVAEIGWRAELYAFNFHTAHIMETTEIPTSSWIEVAYSHQLGGCYVVWFSGVSGLEAPDFCTYGWLECPDLTADFDNAFFRKTLLQDAPLIGYHMDVAAYLDARSSSGQPS